MEGSAYHVRGLYPDSISIADLAHAHAEICPKRPPSNQLGKSKRIGHSFATSIEIWPQNFIAPVGHARLPDAI